VGGAVDIAKAYPAQRGPQDDLCQAQLSLVAHPTGGDLLFCQRRLLSARSCCFFTYADLSGVMPSRAKLGLVYELRETASEAGQAALREHTLLGDDADSTNVR
jgi:hypothetical protein